MYFQYMSAENCWTFVVILAVATDGSVFDSSKAGR